jgi:outer membrane protein OmpA-like peptidoglycan-associated protein
MIETWDFTGAKNAQGQPVDPKVTLKGVDDLSIDRAKTVQDTVQDYARKYNMPLDKNQIRSVGIGVRELVAPVPRSQDAMSKNRRVEFRIYKVPVEATEGGGF